MRGNGAKRGLKQEINVSFSPPGAHFGDPSFSDLDQNENFKLVPK